MMKSAENPSRGDVAEAMNGTTGRRILGKGEMRPELVVIVGVGGKDPAQVTFAEDDDVIEAFPADRANQPLRKPVLPG